MLWDKMLRIYYILYSNEHLEYLTHLRCQVITTLWDTFHSIFVVHSIIGRSLCVSSFTISTTTTQFPNIPYTIELILYGPSCPTHSLTPSRGFPCHMIKWQNYFYTYPVNILVWLSPVQFLNIARHTVLMEAWGIFRKEK